MKIWVNGIGFRRPVLYQDYQTFNNGCGRRKEPKVETRAVVNSTEKGQIETEVNYKKLISKWLARSEARLRSMRLMDGDYWSGRRYPS